MHWLILFLLFLSNPSARYGHNGDVLLPDPRVTPGQTTGMSKDQICNTKWGDDERHVTEKMKDTVCVEYGLQPHCYGRNTYEIDHLIPRELGGADTMPNLWAQSYNQHPGAHEKDRLENALNKLVCAGNIPLDLAQKRIASDWYQLYLLSGLWKNNKQKIDLLRESAAD